MLPSTWYPPSPLDDLLVDSNPVLECICTVAYQSLLRLECAQQQAQLVAVTARAQGSSPTGPARDQLVESTRLALWIARQVVPLLAAADRPAGDALVDAVAAWCDDEARQAGVRAAHERVLALVEQDTGRESWQVNRLSALARVADLALEPAAWPSSAALRAMELFSHIEDHAAAVRQLQGRDAAATRVYADSLVNFVVRLLDKYDRLTGHGDA